MPGQQAYNNQYNKNRDLLGIAGDARGQIANSYGNYINNLANQNNTDLQNYAQNVQGQAANNLAAKGLMRTYLSADRRLTYDSKALPRRIKINH